MVRIVRTRAEREEKKPELHPNKFSTIGPGEEEMEKLDIFFSLSKVSDFLQNEPLSWEKMNTRENGRVDGKAGKGGTLKRHRR